jgi:hypothetical protein
MLCALQATATRAYMEPPPRALIWLSSQGYETCAGLDLVDWLCICFVHSWGAVFHRHDLLFLTMQVSRFPGRVATLPMVANWSG